jgi:hypothetical protein
VSIPIYIGILLIYNLWQYIINNFKNELVYYFHIIGIPLIGILVNILLIGFLKIFSKIKKIKGTEIKTFFLVTLNFNLGLAYVSSNYNFLDTIKKLSAFSFGNLYLAHLFLLAILSELRPFTKDRSRTSITIETIIVLFLIILPFILYYISPKLFNY